ncbi:VanZ family protein [Streptomyces sp. NPDC001380]|uniref:VanZ family protein n=1 Tax=Streptomyces sp. NPDC001380 TaxID=3364566 RepID=UPI00367B0792
MQRGGTGVRAGDGRQPGQGRRRAAPAVWASPRPPATPALRTAGLVLLGVHLAVVAWFALRPVPVAWVYDANLRPFASIGRDLSAGTAESYRRLALGVLAMAPLGVLLPLADGRTGVRWLPSLLRTLAAAGLIRTGLEFLQTCVPGHVLDVDDVLLGLFGVAAAHLAVVPAARARLRRRGGRPGPSEADAPEGAAGGPGGAAAAPAGGLLPRRRRPVQDAAAAPAPYEVAQARGPS